MTSEDRARLEYLIRAVGEPSLLRAWDALEIMRAGSETWYPPTDQAVRLLAQVIELCVLLLVERERSDG